MAQQDFIKAGFSVVGSEDNENKLLSFLKDNYPSVMYAPHQTRIVK